jgi:hypothetical protein
VGQEAPGTAAANDVEDGVQDLPDAVRLGTPGSLGDWQMGLEEVPLGIGEVALVCSFHTRYPTERVPQNPFTDSFIKAFSEVG